jgi:Ca-activated chloride channel homolog
MGLLAPLAIAGLVFVPAVIAMYLLKLRRDEAVVPSTLLWQRLVADVEANAPWQRLRRSLLLLLQLLLVVILVLLAARPFLERPAGLAGDIVLVIDTSASMQATDVAPSRLEAAKKAAIEALKDLPAGGKVSVIAAGRTARVIANGTDNTGSVKQAIAGIAPTSDVGDLGDALRLASALAARSGDAEILVATDAALANQPSGTLEAPVRVLQVGRDARNEAIVALAVRTSPSGLSHSAFISVANMGLEMASRRVELYADGVLRDSRKLDLDPQRKTDISIDDIDDPDHPASVVEVRLVAGDGGQGDGAGAPDPLAVDDRAWAIIPPAGLRRVLLVGEGDPYLETALSYLPDTELYGVTPDDYGPGTKVELFDLVIFEGWLPDELPAKPILAIAPPESSALGTVTGTLQNPGIGSLDTTNPILRYVDLSTTHIAEARRMELPAWAQPVIPGPGTSPLLFAGTLDGRPAAVLAFEPRRSDLPLQVAFPVLLANLAGQLLGGSETPADAVAPGTPVTLVIPGGATGVRVERPDGSVDELVAPSDGAGSVTFARTDLLGVYTVTPVKGPAASPAASASGAPGASAGASAGSEPVAAATFRPADPDAPVRFAVDMLDVDESRIAPGDAAALTALGSTAGPGASAAPGSGTGEPVERPNARDELWIPVVLVALLLLTLEWLVYERDTLARFRRSLTGRLRGRRAAGKGA